MSQPIKKATCEKTQAEHELCPAPGWVVIYTNTLTVWTQDSVYIVHAICKFQALLNLVNTCYDVLWQNQDEVKQFQTLCNFVASFSHDTSVSSYL